MSTSAAPPAGMALLVHPDGRCLLQLRDTHRHIDDPGVWSLPVAHREDGAELDVTLGELLRDRAGILPVAGLVPFAVVEDEGDAAGGNKRFLVYAGTWDGDPTALSLPDGVLLRWTHADEIPRLTIDLKAREIIALHRATPDARRPADGVPLPVLHVRATDNRTVPNIIGVHLYLERGGKILLGRRHPDSPFAPGQHHLLAGHCELESAVACLIRESAEEAGLTVAPEDVELAHTVHVLHGPGARPRLQLVFRARRWTGEPRVLEPDKCLGWDWWPTDALPERLVPYARTAIEGIRQGRVYSETGWS
ncbi:NUDIX domain-containing protein [Streptomyces sp. J2-1]|uniref:NUDIX hydrolase n=1 Tax=Streptomyces corallincola TaxID=2851888 RepID=UPI001C3857E9|nr:NUDIX domain-containing protein [Streptomyces corallincola]MBV2354095.1 NUDIX domain-containing protein [Streptomyces corallincola]